MSSSPDTRFIETKQYQRFKEFCDACRTYQYIGLCYGVPGVGKTVSARYYTNPKKVTSSKLQPFSEGSLERGRENKVILYTPSVVNSPRQISREMGTCRNNFTTVLLNHLKNEELPKLEAMERWMDQLLAASWQDGEQNPEQVQKYNRYKGDYLTAWRDYETRRRELKESKILVVIDEADRLKMASLEQVRAIFDQGGMGLVLVGMPGLEKQLARYPQLYSRVGFVHEFKPLSQAEVRELLREGWAPFDVELRDDALIDEEPLAMLIRLAEGRFRLLYRLLQQIGRIMEVNKLDKVTCQVVVAARESLVIGTA